MNDMGPRRMDGFARPTGGRPVQPGQGGRPAARPAGMRPMSPAAVQAQPSVQPQPVRRPVPQSQPVRQVGPASQADRRGGAQPPLEPAGRSSRGGGLGVLIQFIVGLLVIVGVAAAVVVLWLKYYQ
jgi:hypothetical protein